MIYEANIQGAQRSLRSGTFSNRTPNGANNSTEPKTWTFHDMTSWDSKYYDGKTFSNANIIAGQLNTLTSATANFAPADVGKEIEIFGAGPGGANLVTTILLRQSSTAVTLATSASNPVSNAIIRYGSANKRAYTEGHYTTYSNGNYEMNYRLLFPANYNPLENYKYPMIVFLHGAGERGNCWGGNCFFSPAGTVSRTDGSVTSGSNILNSAGANFTANDVNKLMVINFGPGNSNINTRITSLISSTSVRLLDNSSVTYSGRSFTYGYGSDDQYRNNDLNLVHGGQVHLEAVYNPSTGSNGKKAEDPTLNPRAWPGFVLIPQNQDGWNGPSQYEQAYRIIELTIGAYNVDPDRIYMHGLSNGAAGVWQVATTRPDLFAAILPMSATISPGDPMFNSNSNPDLGINRVRTIPAWIFQGGVDTAPTPNNTNQLVAKLRAAGALPRYTIYPTTGHGTWGAAYNEPDFFSWMLKRNKRDIQIIYGDSTICATDNSGVTLAVGTGFLAYQWERDGIIIPGATSSAYNATVAGRYRARFSRISANPTEQQWNAWSKPVNIRETPAITPAIVATGTSHLPDINGGNLVRINGPTTKDLTKNWYVNGTLSTNNPNFSAFNNQDTASYTLRNTTGRVSLKTIPLNSCSSLESNSIYVTTSTPVTLTAPVSPTAQATAPGIVQLFWTDNTPDENGFEVFRATSATGPYNFFKLLPEGTISYTDTGLTPGTTYYYQLRAVNNTAVSPYTGNITVTTLGDNQPPTAPQNLTLVSKTVTSIKLNWSLSTDNTGVTNYLIFVNGGNTPISTASNAGSYTVTGLTPNANYTFTVAAVDAIGNQSPQSNQLLASTTFTGLNYSHSAVDAMLLTDAGNKWNTPEVTGTIGNFDLSQRRQDTYFNFKFEGYIKLPANAVAYNFRSTSDDGSAIYIGAEGTSAFPFDPASPTTNQVYNNDGLHGCQENSSYSLQNVTFSGGFRPITVIMFQREGGFCLNVQYKLANQGSGSWSNVQSIYLTTGSAPALTPPATPTNLAASSNSMTNINLNWDVVPISEYEIYRSIDNLNYTMIGRVPNNSYTDMSLNPNTLYYYKVKSVNGNGSSGFSNFVSAATLPDSQAPTTPLNLVSISNSYTNASFQWDASVDNVAVAGYKVYANGALLGTSTTTTYYTTALLPATFYAITVSAYDVSGNESLQSTAAAITTQSPQNFYSKPSSDLSQLSSWSLTSDGTGPSPTSFGYNGQYFTIQNTQTLTNSLTIGGNVSRVIVNDGITLNVSQPLTGTIRVGSNSVVNINVDYQPIFETIAVNSTVNFNTYSNVPVANYGNLVLNGSGLKNVSAGTLQIQGNLTLASGVGLKGAPSNATTLVVTGDVNFGSAVAQVASDNRVVLQFTNGLHNINTSSDQFLNKITANTGATVTFNNLSGSPKSLNLGSLNGGGLDLANGSTFVVGSNNLVLTDKSTVNPSNTTGEISISNGSIQFTSTANNDANFYFATGNNRVNNFTIQESGSGSVHIRKAVEIYDGLKINGGTLSANGNVTLKSTATASAAIQTIASGGTIVGNVAVERYMAPKRVYRYLSTPVSGVMVSDWQNYFPITGGFTNASPGTANPSMFIYNESLGLGQNGYAPYPTTNNTAAIQPGRGYVAFVRDGFNPTTLVQTGVPNQGNFTFTLTGGTGSPANGWNLLGNPYASDIVWSNTGWTSSGVGNVVSVRENLPGGGVTWRIWDRSTNTGNLPNGQIPAGQGFWIQTSTSNPSLVVTESAKTNLPATSNNNFFRSSDGMPNNVLAIGLSNGSQNDVTYIKLSNNGTDTYDKLSDGAKNQNSFFNISTLSADSVDLAVNELSNEFCEKNIQIKLATIAPGSYTMQFDNSDKFNWAQVQLIDKFTNTTQSLTESNSQYSFSVTTDLASYANRFSLKLTRPSITTDNQIISNKDVFCANDSFAVVEVKNSQSGVEYQATNAQGQYLSTVVTGNGETIQLTIPLNKLAPNANTIQVKASFAGCNSVQLTNQKSISVYALPSITAPATVAGCIGGTLDLKVSGDGVRYEWINASSGEILSETTNTLHISTINALSGFQVASFNSIGCKSEPAQILVRADSLATPSISMEEGALLTAPANNIQWLWNGEAIAGANDIRFTPTLSGNYTVQANSVYCSKVSAPYLVTASEDSNSNGLLVTVFPNPSETGMVNIKGSSDIKGSLALSVTDLVGREVIVQIISFEDFSSGVELQHKLAPGVYIFKATLGHRTAHHKVIVR
ncbi:MAG: fibronectin type III domain-containing protein [Bacteroidetes bacterium]|nr:fibronectin type III domain-containing protein [Bacteroidota bacterium]